MEQGEWVGGWKPGGGGPRGGCLLPRSREAESGLFVNKI